VKQITAQVWARPRTNPGHAGRVDLAGAAIPLARQLALATEEPEARGLLALMLLNHARFPARLDPEGRIVTPDRQDRGLWDTREIAVHPTYKPGQNAVIGEARLSAIMYEASCPRGTGTMTPTGARCSASSNCR
jgi:predicted RNA polymerase sigma factor